MLHRDSERRLAIVELLALPDPPDLRRGYRVRLEGRGDRYDQVPMLSAAFVQAKLLELQERRAEMISEETNRSARPVLLHWDLRKATRVAA
jgi:hypothetical protein